MRARGVAGRHVRISEKEGAYHLDLYKGAGGVSVNGHEFVGGPIGIGDRITIGEATITVLNAQPTVSRMVLDPRPAVTIPLTAPATAPPSTEVEFRDLRMTAYRLCRDSATREELATELTDFLDREFPPSEWAVGEFSASGFRPLASIPGTRASAAGPHDGARASVARARASRNVTLITEPPRKDDAARARR